LILKLSYTGCDNMEINSTIRGKNQNTKGIPCKVNVLTFSYQKADRRTWASTIDYHGGYIVEFEIRDRKGYKAPWLYKKVTDKDFERIEQEIIDQFGGENHG